MAQQIAGDSGWNEGATNDSFSSDPQNPSVHSLSRIVLTAVVVTVIIVVVVVGNVLVIIAINRDKVLKGLQYWFIASLAVADLIIGLVVMPFSLARELLGYWPFGDLWCSLHAAIDVLACTSSINNICLISLDRYWSITKAVEYLRTRTRRRAALMLAAVWVFSALISIPPLLGWRQSPPQTSVPMCQLSEDIGYVLYSALGSFYIPSIIMIFVYIRIYFAARTRARRHMNRKLPQASGEAIKMMQLRPSASTRVVAPSSIRHERPRPEQVPIESEETAASRPTPPTPVSTEQNSALMTLAVVTRVSDDKQHHEQAPQSDLSASDTASVRRKKEAARSQSRADRSADPERINGEEEAESSSIESMVQQEVVETRPKSSARRAMNKLLLKKMNRTNSNVSSLYSCDHPPLNFSTKTARAGDKERRRVARKKEKRATLILGLIMGSFIACWLPFFILYVLTAFCTSCSVPDWGFGVAFWLGYFNSALNPVIYTIFNKDFRQAFRRIVCK